MLLSYILKIVKMVDLCITNFFLNLKVVRNARTFCKGFCGWLRPIDGLLYSFTISDLSIRVRLKLYFDLYFCICQRF